MYPRYLLIAGSVLVMLLIVVTMSGTLMYTYSTNAEAELWDVVPESVAGMVCTIGLERGYDYLKYEDNPVGDTVFTIADIPDDMWENEILPYIEDKYTQAGIPIKLKWVKKENTNYDTYPESLGEHTYTLEAKFLKLGVTKYWRIEAVVVKVGDSQFKCYTRKW